MSHSNSKKPNRPSQEEAMEAVKTLISWAGDDPNREGLLDTPKRVVKSYRELFAGYDINPTDLLQRTFGEIDNYQDMIILKDIEFESHCEHHILPIIGKVHIGYLARDRVVGISKFARVVNAYAKRLQIQEKFTAQIANAIHSALNPIGAGVVVEANHHCMATRGVHKSGVCMKTSHMTGLFRSDSRTRREFLSLISET